MRLEKTEGTTTVYNDNGKKIGKVHELDGYVVYEHGGGKWVQKNLENGILRILEREEKESVSK
ncbi:hypothetical protein HXA31_20580 [Salipaludibacillus agaradhaerens]|jgi:archaeosine-15-forming tRNA-guanine transglycosylase|uniref:Uncharacterized protein n=1 Tax=Salipaludibacillus agaradhaerens TaxID=76935 RepID=A0A9Q4FXR9_SALAG|nr:hypothetical protein [Salipaludibacillus agaradhaerens]MCR6096885.1 hypothetical protein [Salipaludibacillus agaradhaerens]MCR6116729.1 hypothetical protein [Salipaludibacillus agaradhaerens]